MANVYRFLKDTFGGNESYAISGGVNTSYSVAAGDMMQWDATSRYATNALLASGSIFLGVSEDANPMASLGTSTQPLTGGRCRIKSDGIHAFKTTAGDVYSHLDPVYQGADAQTVTLTSATRLIGRVWLPGGTQVTAATGVTVPVRIYGAMTLQGRLPALADKG